MNRLPDPIESLSDNGSCYTAGDTRAFARDIGLVPRTTPVSSPQSNGMTDFVAVYNYVRRLKILRGLTPHEHIRKSRADEPQRFMSNPHH